MKKVLSIFMAILMVVTMFSFSTVAFAEESEAVAKDVFIGAGKNYGYEVKGRPPQLTEKDSSRSAPWNYNVFNPETPIEGLSNKVEVPEVVGDLIINRVNDDVASGEYSVININVTASPEASILFKGLKGTESTPIVILTDPTSVGKKEFKSTTDAPAVTIEDCEYVTIKDFTVTSASNGIEVTGCKNVVIENITFSSVGFVDYVNAQPVIGEDGTELKDENGEVIQAVPDKETKPLADKGTAVYIGTDCDGVTVSACSFTECRAGVVADSSALAEGETATTGVSVLGCTFKTMSDAAVYVNGTDDVVVSGGSVTLSGTLASAPDYAAEPVAAIYLEDVKNATIEKIYSTDNASFLEAWGDTTGRVRYNISVRDGYSLVVAPELLIYNNTFAEAGTLELNATVKNNIFSMNIGEKVILETGNNNCYYWTSKGDNGSIRKNPRFAFAYTAADEGKSVTDNYILAVGSPCLNAGEKVEEDMGTDFYGNAEAGSINIGADAFGTGAETELTFASDFVDLFNYIIAVIKNFFANLFA